MRKWVLTWGMVVVASWLAVGCVKTAERAAELSEQNLYQGVVYANAAKKGPKVLVVPGIAGSGYYEFACAVTPDKLCDYAELEFGKANFPVLDRSSLKERLQEIALAVNMSDSTALRNAVADVTDKADWLVRVSVVDATPQTLDCHFTDKQSSAMAGALMGSMLFGGGSGAQAGAAVIGSINSVEENRKWTVDLAYEVIDPQTGAVVHQGQLKDVTTLLHEIKGFLGVDNAEKSGKRFDALVQKLVQQAVQDMDKALKSDDMLAKVAARQPAAAEKKTAKGKKRGKRTAAPKPPKAKPAAPAEQAAPVGFVQEAAWAYRFDKPADWNTAPAVDLRQELQKAQMAPQGMQALAMQSALNKLFYEDPHCVIAGPDFNMRQRYRSGDVKCDVFLLPGVAKKVSPLDAVRLTEQALRQKTIAELLGQEVVTVQGADAPVYVYKLVLFETQRQERKKPKDLDAQKSYMTDTEVIKIPHFHNLALAPFVVGDDLALVVMSCPEDQFRDNLERVKHMVASWRGV